MAEDRIGISTFTVDRLREVLDYDPETGVFRWKVLSGRRAKIGDIAGTVSKNKRTIGIDGQRYAANRLAWAHFYGEDPVDIVDHKNRDSDDNSIENLRLADKSKNAANSKIKSGNLSGFKGVTLHRPSGRFFARVQVHGKSIYLGYFDTSVEAHNAYVKAAKLHFGEFANAG